MKIGFFVSFALACVAQAQVFTSIQAVPPALNAQGVVCAPGPRPAAGAMYRVDVGALGALLLGAQAPQFRVVRVVSTQPDVKGYVRVRNHELFPSLASAPIRGVG